jgi:hypothetical protein
VLTSSTSEDDLITWVASCQHDPLAFARGAWDWGSGDLAGLAGPRPWQADILGLIRDHLADPQKRFEPLQIAVASGHGIGKSALMGMVSAWAMSAFDKAKVLATANTDTQLRTKTAPEVGRWFQSAITGHWFDVRSAGIKARDKAASDAWRMDFIPWSEHNTEAFAGLHNKGRIIVLLFDEASKIADKVWEVAEGAMTDEGTVLIWIAFGNPTRNTGRFRECFRRFRAWWVTRQIDSRTVPGTNKAYLQRLVDQYGEDSDVVKYRVRGMFPSASARQFISTEDVDAARRVHLTPQQYGFAPAILGVDPAWTGEDEFVIVLRQGLYSKVLATFARNDDDMQMAAVIARLEREHRAAAVFVDGGFGTGIVSAGRSMGRAWQLIWFSGKPADPGCVNKRAEMWRDMRDWLKAGGAIDPADDVLYHDLIAPELVGRPDGKVLLESKDDMKGRDIPSPNRADALALTFAHPVFLDAGDGADGVEVEYRPYG